MRSWRDNRWDVIQQLLQNSDIHFAAVFEETISLSAQGVASSKYDMT